MSEQPIRVVLAVSSLEGGGSERQTAAILRRLDRRRFRPAVYLVSRTGPLLDELPDDAPSTAFWSERRRPPRLYWPGRIHRLQARHLASFLKRVRADVVYDRTYFLSLLTAAAARIRPTPRISVAVSPPQQELAGARERFLPVKRWLLRRAYASAFRAGAVSEYVRRAMIQYYRLPPNQAATLYNGVDIERIERLGREPPPPWSAQPGFHIVALGRLHPAKGHRVLLLALARAAARRPELRLHVYGEGPERDELHRLGRSLGLAPAQLQWAGFAPNPYPALRSAQLFCLSSLYDGMPNALLEAMACGVPVVAADCPGGVREIAGSAELGELVPPGDPIALAAALLAAAAAYPERRRRAEAARRRVAERFAIERTVARLEELLEQAARTAPRVAARASRPTPVDPSARRRAKV